MRQDTTAARGLSLSGEKVHLEPAPRGHTRRNCLGKFQATEQQLATTVSISARHLVCYTKRTNIPTLTSNYCNGGEVQRIPYTLKINSSLGDGIEAERGGVLMKIQEADSVQQLQGLLRAVRPVSLQALEGAQSGAASPGRNDSVDDALELADAGAIYERCFLVHQLALSDIIVRHLAT